MEALSEFPESVTRSGSPSPQNRCVGGDAAEFCQFRDSVTRASAAEFAEVTESTKSDTQRNRARAREEDGDRNPDAHRCRGFNHQPRRQRVELCHYERR